MNILWALFLAVIFGAILAKEPEFEPLSDAQIEYINSVQSSWRAGRNFHPDQYHYAKNMLGVDIEKNAELTRRLPRKSMSISEDDLPTNFDAREHWPDCDSIKEVRDQGECGSCWAFGAAEAMSDRICVNTGKNVRISAEDLLSCCNYCTQNGCHGGFPVSAWEYYQNEGVVTGGSYNSNEGCMPYTIEPCDHHCSGKLRNCSSTIVPTPNCTLKCRDGYPYTYNQDKQMASASYNIYGVKHIMGEIYTNGSITAVFVVYEDFLSYKSGVYKHVTGKELAGHCVKIIGWGVENGTDYWLVANSWNTDWGMEGFFKIAKGVDECQIEDWIIAGMPLV